MSSKRQRSRSQHADMESVLQPAANHDSSHDHPADHHRLLQRAHDDKASLTPRDVVQLQRTIGNQAVQRLLAGSAPRQNASTAQHETAAGSMGGKKPGGQYAEGEVIGGRTAGEFLGDIGRPISTGFGNIIGGIAGAVTGVSINSSDMTGPTWNDHGHFDWGAMFTTTGKSGWIVQEITNTYRAEDATGNDVTPAHTPHYWEAWSVDDNSVIDPTFVDARGCDDWIRPPAGDDTQGHWSMRGHVHFTTTDPTASGMASGTVPDAGGLLSSTTAPDDLGIARLHRYAQGTWDSTGDTPTHSGSAR